jgi:hypothetical protein
VTTWLRVDVMRFVGGADVGVLAIRVVGSDISAEPPWS